MVNNHLMMGRRTVFGLNVKKRTVFRMRTVSTVRHSCKWRMMHSSEQIGTDKRLWQGNLRRK